MAGKVIFLTGLSGMGKSAVSRKVVENMPNWKIATFSDMMFGIAKKKRLAKDKDELRALPVHVQHRLQSATFDRLRSIAWKSDLIINTHAVIPTPNGSYSGLPERQMRKFREFDVWFVNLTMPHEKMGVLIERNQKARGTLLFRCGKTADEIEKALLKIEKRVEDRPVLQSLLLLAAGQPANVSIGGLLYRVESDSDRIAFFEPHRSRAEYTVQQLASLDTEASRYILNAARLLNAPIVTYGNRDEKLSITQDAFLGLVARLETLKAPSRWQRLLGSLR